MVFEILKSLLYEVDLHAGYPSLTTAINVMRIVSENTSVQNFRFALRQANIDIKIKSNPIFRTESVALYEYLLGSYDTESAKDIREACSNIVALLGEPEDKYYHWKDVEAVLDQLIKSA